MAFDSESIVKMGLILKERHSGKDPRIVQTQFAFLKPMTTAKS